MKRRREKTTPEEVHPLFAPVRKERTWLRALLRGGLAGVALGVMALGVSVVLDSEEEPVPVQTDDDFPGLVLPPVTAPTTAPGAPFDPQVCIATFHVDAGGYDAHGPGQEYADAEELMAAATEHCIAEGRRQGE